MKPALPVLACFLAAAAGSWAAGNSPLAIKQTVELRFPSAFDFSSISSGEASVIINVDADGNLADLLVSSYTQKPFADAAVAALKLWRYTPAQEEGQPVGIRMELKFDFSATGRVVSLLPMDAVEALFARASSRPATVRRVCLPPELDDPIVPLTSISPPHPGKLTSSLPPSGSVVVDFYIDEYGQPRMPVVIKSPHRAYSMAAVSALTQWRFTLPTRGGQPVVVRVRQEFIFPADT